LSWHRSSALADGRGRPGEGWPWEGYDNDVELGHTGAVIDGELGAFLRTRRESVRPTDVGLPVGSRRRAPGLRRAELATLAGISVDYLIRLEQGRDRHPSTQVLAAIARALRLGSEDLHHLHELSVVSQGTELLCPQARASRLVRPTIRRLLELLEPAPAYVVNHLGAVLAWTDTFDHLARPLGLLDDDEPNTVWFTFTDSRARTAFVDWEVVADDEAARLHEYRQGDPAADELAHRLSQTAGATFAERWERLPVGARRHGARTIHHPTVGALNLAFETLRMPDNDRQHLVIYLPDDPATIARIDQLSGRQPGSLRAV
jgi:transcriptional regulator with XRE-family HTH domain